MAVSQGVKGALSGAGTGATLGSSFGPWGTLIGAGVGAIGGGAIGAVQDKQNKKALKEAQGLSDAERRQAVARAMENAGQQAGQAQTMVARDSLSDKGGRNMGAYKQAQGVIGQQAANAGAQASLQVDQLSQQIGEARRQEILDRMDRDADKSELGRQAARKDASSVAAYMDTQNAAAVDQGYTSYADKFMKTIRK